MAPRTNPTETEKRLARIEQAIAQLAHGVRVGVGWKREYNGQHELVEIIAEQQAGAERETRPAAVGERRVKAAV
jgi:hypothetical protein